MSTTNPAALATLEPSVYGAGRLVRVVNAGGRFHHLITVEMVDALGVAKSLTVLSHHVRAVAS